MLVAFNIKASLRLIPLKELRCQLNWICELVGGVILLLGGGVGGSGEACGQPPLCLVLGRFGSH